MTPSDIAALALCQLDSRWDYLNEQQRAILLKNSRSGKAYRAAKRAAEIALKYAATQKTPDERGAGSAVRPHADPKAHREQVGSPNTADPDLDVAGKWLEKLEQPSNAAYRLAHAQRGYLGTDAVGSVDDADRDPAA